MRARRHGVALVGLIVVVASAVLAVLAPAVAPDDPVRNDLLERLTPPLWMDGGSWRHPLGTDTLSPTSATPCRRARIRRCPRTRGRGGRASPAAGPRRG